MDETTGAWAKVMDDARAALTAMREPSAAMARKGASLFTDLVNEFHITEDEAEQVWHAMIDAALNEGGEG